MRVPTVAELSPGDRPILELVEVTKTYSGSPVVAALRGVSMNVRAGEFVAIVGPSGSGKSTLLNILGLLDTPTSGRFLFAGVDMATSRERVRTALRATRIGFVFQAFHLVPYLNIVRNVTLPMVHGGGPAHRDRRSAAIAALESVGLGHRLTARPTMLSGGEQQRVAIARAIVNDPTIVLCDEPTGNLDRENSAAILRLLRSLVTVRRALVVVTHDPEIAAQADRVIRLADGYVV
jgi:putative ABC transport system ATP-binding protein